MPLDHSKATASICIKGLALSCYNPDSSLLEVGFLRHPQHILTIDIVKVEPEGPSVFRFSLDQNHKIFIDAEGVIAPKEPLFMPGDFDRQTPANNDPEDLRWLVDIE